MAKSNLPKVLAKHPSEWTMEDAIVIYGSERPGRQWKNSNWMKFNTVVSNRANERLEKVMDDIEKLKSHNNDGKEI